jgi:hypothetical protein
LLISYRIGFLAEFLIFIRISKNETPPPIPEKGFYDPFICSPFDQRLNPIAVNFCNNGTLSMENQADENSCEMPLFQPFD